MQTSFKLDIWLQSSEKCINDKNNKKQKNYNTVFANISKAISPTSDSFPLIMSHITQIGSAFHQNTCNSTLAAFLDTVNV